MSQHFEYSFLSTSLLTYLANTSFYVYEYVMGYSVQSLASQDKQYPVVFPHPPRQPFPQKTLGLAKHLFTQATMTMPNHLLVLCKFAKVFLGLFTPSLSQNKEADQSVVPQILLGLLQDSSDICFLQALRNLS